MARAGVGAHTAFLAFFFLACATWQFGAGGGRLRTRHFLLFSFWRVRRGSLEPPGAAPHTPFLAFFFLTCAARQFGAAGGAAPHTPFLAFFFLTCAAWQFGASGGGSAHAISCFFLFDVCSAAVWSRQGRLRTRHFLLFSFWRVQRGGCHAYCHFSLPRHDLSQLPLPCLLPLFPSPA